MTITVLAILPLVALAQVQGLSVGIAKGDTFAWTVETSGDYQPFSETFLGRDYDKVQQISLDVAKVVSPVVNYEMTISYDNGTQVVENHSENLETGLHDSVRGFFYPAGLNSGDTFVVGDMESQVDRTETRTYSGIERQVNHYKVENLSNNGLALYVNGETGWLQMSFENYFDRSAGVLIECREFWEAVGLPYNVTLTYLLVESTPNAMNAGLSESASALNYGNEINFTVTVSGGAEPYSYAWYVDNQLAQTTSSPYYSINSLGVGEHHVYVIVTDANSSTATTLAVAFDVLPSSSSSPQPSPSVPEVPAWIAMALVVATGLSVLVWVKRNGDIVHANEKGKNVEAVSLVSGYFHS